MHIIDYTPRNLEGEYEFQSLLQRYVDEKTDRIEVEVERDLLLKSLYVHLQEEVRRVDALYELLNLYIRRLNFSTEKGGKNQKKA